ncbi:MAG: hypothetical protein OXE46_15975 [Chloroflexi bacterium]|nr:hypothetical protein [Chloroflexota bacterium]
MFNLEGRHNWDWLALPCPAIASRVIMLLILAALLALAAPAAHAAGCTAFAYTELEGENGIIYPDVGDDGFYYVIVPASNFLTGKHKIYVDEKCDVHPEPGDSYLFGYPDTGEVLGVAFAKNGRKAMESCESNLDKTVAYVSIMEDEFLTSYHCVLGERWGPKRQRRQYLYTVKADNKKKALAACRESAKLIGTYPRPTNVARDGNGRSGWDCFHAWKVNNRYLKRVGA